VSELFKFIFEGLPVRGMLVRLTDGWQDVLKRRADAGDAFPPPVRALLGEMAAAGVLMQANIQFDGALILQAFGDGPVKLAVAEIGADLAFRVTATVRGAVAEDADLAAMLNAQGGGRCAITLAPVDRRSGQQPYQGVVPLHGDAREPLQAIAPVLEHYMLQSEQLDTRLVLAADDNVAAGLLLQRLPAPGGAVDETRIGRDEDFNRVSRLAATLTRDELLGLDADTVLRRLFWEEKLTRFAPLVGVAAPRFACTCSRAKVGAMLRSLGRAEIDDIIREQAQVEVGCEFCGLRYRFDPVDVGELFVAPADQAPGSSAIN
jgi:molecular chaperone Hsp33